MSLTIEQWHERYQQQAYWTRNLRQYVFERIGLQTADKILDVGCGTGVILEELGRLSSASLHGVDIDPQPLMMVKNTLPYAMETRADAHKLPFYSRVFNITLCHFVMLWLAQPRSAIDEMVRVTRLGGFVCALAEPDYGGRIDYPPELAVIGEWQIEALREQGANPLIGRELMSLFSQAGLANIEAGVLGGQWNNILNLQEFELEWLVVQADLERNKGFIDSAEKLKALELNARRKQQRVLYVPTFYVFGQVLS